MSKSHCAAAEPGTVEIKTQKAHNVNILFGSLTAKTMHKVSNMQVTE